MVFPARRRWLTLAAGCSLSLTSVPGVRAQETGEAPAKIDSPLAVQPKTPDELFRAALFTLQLDRPDVAKKYLEALMAGNPDDELLLKLRDTHGTAMFMELARSKDLQPVATELLDRIRNIALARISDPQVVDGLIDRLSSESPREQYAALQELKHLRANAVPHLLRRATAETNALPVDKTVETLVAVGSSAVSPLVAALLRGPEPVQGIAAEALGHLGGSEAELALWYPAFSSSSSVALQHAARSALARIVTGDPTRTDSVDPFAAGSKLRNRAELYYNRRINLTAGDDGLVGVWSWSDAQQGLVETRTSADKASLYFAEAFARQAVDLSGEQRAPEVLLLAILLARDVEQAGWDKPAPEGPGTAHDLALSAGPEVTEQVLKLALASRQYSTAIAALRVLEQNGSRRQLNASGSDASPVLAALDVPEPRVQFAAAETILQWDPETAFPKSRRVVEILARALEGDARPDGVVIDPNNERGTQMGSYLSLLGYDPRVVSTGQEGFLAAAARGDVAVAVIHLNAIRWDLSQTVAQLRADTRTANIPIAIYGPAGLQGKARHLENSYQRVAYVEEANNSFEVSRQLRPLLAQVTPPALNESQRAEVRGAAVNWLRHIAVGQRTKVFDLTLAETALSNAVNDPEIGSSAVVALGGIPSATAQDRLLDTTINETADPGLRTTAARQLGFHIQRFGLLLSNESVDRLKSRIAVETEPATLSALAAVIGSLKPDAKVVRERLLSYPVSEAPLP